MALVRKQAAYRAARPASSRQAAALVAGQRTGEVRAKRRRGVFPLGMLPRSTVEISSLLAVSLRRCRAATVDHL